MNGVTLLMQYFYEELEKEHWGDIDPWWFQEPKESSEEHVECFNSLKSCLGKALDRYFKGC